MDRGGAETWLMHVLRHIDRSKFQLDFLTHTNVPCAYDDAIRALGSSLLVCENPAKPWAYAAAFKRLMETQGPYDVVHSHLHHFSGFVLRCAAKANIPVRIAHSHSDTLTMDTQAPMLRRGYTGFARAWIGRYSTHGLAVSRAAAQALFGLRWAGDPRFSVLHCGIDLAEFQARAGRREDFCREWKLPADAMIVGHVGRFTAAKNHDVLIEIFARIRDLEPRAFLVLAGEGALRAEVERRIARAGLTDSCRLLGARNDVPQFLSRNVDVLLLPSRWEGLPLVLMESQAAGVPCLCSDVVTAEAIEIPNLVFRLPLSQPLEEWAEAALRIARGRVFRNEPQPLRGTRFDIQVGVGRLEQIYSDSIASRGAL